MSQSGTFSGENLLVVLPTNSGKTRIAAELLGSQMLDIQPLRKGPGGHVQLAN